MVTVANSAAELECTLPLDDPEILMIVIGFAGRFRDRLIQACQNAQKGDWPAVVQFAHWLKGTGGSVGFPQLTQPAADLERFAKMGGGREAIELCQHLSTILVQIFQILQR